jgi:hypothetical protein
VRAPGFDLRFLARSAASRPGDAGAGRDERTRAD